MVETRVKKIGNWIGGKDRPSLDGKYFEKRSPHSGDVIWEVPRSSEKEIHEAVSQAKKVQKEWAQVPAVQRGNILFEFIAKLREKKEEIAHIVADETGKSFKESLGETQGAIQLGQFYAGEGQRLYGRTTTSGRRDRHVMTIRQPVGVAGLIIAANTPIANIAWKVFPALICGNAAVVKAAEDTPMTAWIFAKIATEAGLPPGILNVVQGYGNEAGQALVNHPDVRLISFTGSTAVGRQIAVKAGERLAKVSLELGGKNALVVCDDADLENAVHWTVLSAFSNAGQRCASASRIVVFEPVYEKFKMLLIESAETQKVGPADSDDFGPVINEKQLKNMLAAIQKAQTQGAKILAGGERLTGPQHASGCYLAPTVIEGASPGDPIAQTELFGPIALLFKVSNFQEALELTNDNPYGLTAAIHTKNIDRALKFMEQVDTGVASINGGTYGSEPHMPFGGTKLSGNGTREPGTEALDVYTNLKDVYINVDSQNV
ncbi:aldehyde dehydrogenase family protein [Omnitrophica bacterium]|nr:aldehyde dehydrogenase family protein [Candidatus Omnitrophota bacterium]